MNEVKMQFKMNVLGKGVIVKGNGVEEIQGQTEVDGQINSFIHEDNEETRKN